MKAYPKFRYGLSILTAIFIPLASHAQDSESPETQAFYLFMSGKVSAQAKKQFYPVESFNGKRLNLDGYKRTLKPSKNLNCTLSPLMVISPYYAEIRDLEYSFDSNTEKFRTMMVINEMNAEQMRFEAGNEFEKAVANMDRQGKSVPFTQQDIDNIELDELTKDQKEDELLKAGFNKMIDSLYVRCTLVPDRSVDNAYATAVIRIEAAGNSDDRISFARIAPIGSLEAGIGKPVKFESSFPELRAGNADIDLFIYDGDGKHIATNRSRGLQKLTPEELEELRNLDKQAREKNAG
ncbi:MAG: hypothetical protein VYC82_05435 [Verrucomicrobiota bacterium]|nr:hypothetical protein [Verrucomicrobiota bacterium]